MSAGADFEGLTAIVTGGSSGIGRAITTRLIQGGASVAVLDLAPFPDSSPHVYSYEADVTDDASVRRATAEVVTRFGGLDLLVNNVGIGIIGRIEDNDDAEWHRAFDVNVMSIVRVTRSVVDSLRASESAAVVNLSSIAATTGLPDRAVYSATKGAVQALTYAMATDLMPDGVRVNSVNPGTVDTPFVQANLAKAADPDEELQSLQARQPHGRLVAPVEVADAVAYLLSPRSGSTSGTALAVDAGFDRLRPRPRS